jgi:hypothetical protein
MKILLRYLRGQLFKAIALQPIKMHTSDRILK